MGVEGRVLPVDVLVERVAARVAPSELSEAHVADRRRPADDGALGAGIDVNAAQLLVPAVTFVCSGVAATLVQGATDPLRERVTSGVERLLARIRRRRAEPTVRINRDWTTEDLARIRSVALAKARAFGLQQVEAELIADAVVGVLVSERDR
ncbi:hypothetical protein [Micromonospora thermarum]|uniref:Uncharacterized protein n=1 Tax=Micromonospora thermarum TaxID=2720024 RepID=A0ABX0ZC61_9ACTN|nr:hypothetical protein [Micromonospora thermarum]NJP33540.1 hypothetical protein [Micromonospora thermarum]